jgi:hypothetical protein
MLAVDLFSPAVRDESPVPVMSLTDRISAPSFSTALPGGFATCSFILNCSEAEAFDWYATKQGFHVLIHEGGASVWEGRIEGIGMTSTGVSVNCAGYWSAMTDRVLYQFWSADKINDYWRPASLEWLPSTTGIPAPAISNQKFSFASDAGLYVALLQTSYLAGDRACLAFVLPVPPGDRDDFWQQPNHVRKLILDVKEIVNANFNDATSSNMCYEIWTTEDWEAGTWTQLGGAYTAAGVGIEHDLSGEVRGVMIRVGPNITSTKTYANAIGDARLVISRIFVKAATEKITPSEILIQNIKGHITPPASMLKFNEGFYDGNNLTAEIDVGFDDLKVVIIKPDSASHGQACIKTVDMPNTSNLTNSTENDAIISLNGDSFTVDGSISTGHTTNRTGCRYRWMAWGGDLVETGTYQGNDLATQDILSDESLVDVRMAWVVYPAKNGGKAVKTIGMPVGTSATFSNVTPTDEILEILYHGFRVGNSTNINNAGETYYYVMFANASNLYTGNYVGNSIDNTNVPSSSMDWNADLVFVRQITGSALAYLRPVSLTGDLSFAMSEGVSVANAIQSLSPIAGKFQVGSLSAVNFSAFEYHFFAFQIAAITDSGGIDLVPQVDQLRTNVANIRVSDTPELSNINFQNVTLQDIAAQLGPLADSSALRSWYPAVWDNRLFHFGPRVIDHVKWRFTRDDLADQGFQLERTLDNYYSHIQAFYENDVGAKRSSAVKSDPRYRSNIPVQRRSTIDMGSIPVPDTARDAFYEDFKIPQPKAQIIVSGMAHDILGSAVPLWHVRAGDVFQIDDLLPGRYLRGNDALDPLRTFFIKETSYDAATGQLSITPSWASDRLENLLANIESIL